MQGIKLKNHKAAQCHINIYGDKIEFISYNTRVIEATRTAGNIYELKCSGLYSMTTRRQIGWFISEYFNSLNYYDIKEIAGTENTIDAELTIIGGIK